MDKLTKSLKDNIAAILLVILGSLSWSLTMIKSGWRYEYGIGFWGPNGHDGVWHVSLIESISRGDFGMPVFAGEGLKNYHIGFDFLVAILHRLTFIPVVTLYFQIIPIIIAVGIGISSYAFVFEWTKSKTKALWSLFFVYFGGSWGWIITLLRSNELGGESMFWSQQSISTLINPPFALSLWIVFVSLWLLVKSEKKHDNRLLIIATFFCGILVQIKVYAGLLILAGLLTAGFYRMIIERKGIAVIKIFAGSLIVSLILFLPFNTNTSVLVWKPFWFLETMMALSDRLYWPKMAEAMANYKSGLNILKGIPAYILAFAIFWFGNLGTRVIKEIFVIRWFRDIKKISWVEVLLATIIVAGALVPLFFVQTGTPWNTIQFMYYSLVFSGILAGVVVGEWLEKSRYTIGKYLAAGAIIVFTLPTTYSTLTLHYLPSRPPAKLSNDEISALKFLSRQTEGTVLTYPFNKEKADIALNNPPRPLSLYESTAYVSAFAKKNVYLEDEVNLNITGYNWPERRKNVLEFLDTPDQDIARNFLMENDIRYIYWLSGQRATLGEKQLGLEKIYENNEVSIYTVLH